jgi:hypothetical protein
LSIPITDRLTAAIRLAEQSIEMAQYQADHRNWKEVLRVLQDARDELGKPPTLIIDRTSDELVPAVFVERISPPKIDGRTKEARALKAAQ